MPGASKHTDGNVGIDHATKPKQGMKKIISKGSFKYYEVCSFSIKTDKFSFWSFPLKHKNHQQQSLMMLLHMKHLGG